MATPKWPRWTVPEGAVLGYRPRTTTSGRVINEYFMWTPAPTLSMIGWKTCKEKQHMYLSYDRRHMPVTILFSILGIRMLTPKDLEVPAWL